MAGFGSYNNPKGGLIPGTGGPLGSWTSNVRYIDMGPTVGGVSRGTNIGGTFTDVYDETGSGLLIGFLVTLENAFDIWEIRLVIDSTDTIFTINTEDLEKNNLYGYDKGGDNELATFLGFNIHDNTIRWNGPLDFPLTYSSRIQVQARYTKGGSKKFRAGLLARTV